VFLPSPTKDKLILQFPPNFTLKDGEPAVESIGATYLSQETLSAERRAALMNNIDLVYEAVGASSLAFQVLNVLKANSVFVFTGVPGRNAPSEFDTDLLMRNIVLKNRRPWHRECGT